MDVDEDWKNDQDGTEIWTDIGTAMVIRNRKNKMGI